MDVQGALSEFANCTSLHGVPRIIHARSIAYRCFWSIICLGAFTVFAWSASNLLTQYSLYPKKVNVEIVQLPVPFPAVTVCNVDHLDMVVVDRLEKTYSETYSEEHFLPEEFESRYLAYSDTCTSFAHYYPEEHRFKDMFEVSSRVGLVANLGLNMSSGGGIAARDFIVSSRFLNEDSNNTSADIFLKVFDPYYFNCFTFQPQHILSSRSTRLSGVEYGLSVILFPGCAGKLTTIGDSTSVFPGMVQGDPALATGGGVRVVIHAPYTIPRPKADGYDIPSGFSVTLGVKAKQNQRIGPPHGNCTKVNDDQNNSSYVYTLISCQNQCIQRRIMESCRCVDNTIELPLQSGLFHSRRTGGVTGGHADEPEGFLPFCLQLPQLPKDCLISEMVVETAAREDSEPDSESAKSSKPDTHAHCKRLAEEFEGRMRCRKDVFEQMTTSDVDVMATCNCFPPCSDLSYDVSYSLSTLPEQSMEHSAFYKRIDDFHHYDLDKAKKKILEFKHGPNYTDTIKRSIARLNVHIAESNIVKTTESPDYELIRLVSDIGGQLGLWIGVSVITLVEVLQLAADIIRLLLIRGGGGGLSRMRPIRASAVDPSQLDDKRNGRNGEICPESVVEYAKTSNDYDTVYTSYKSDRE